MLSSSVPALRHVQGHTGVQTSTGSELGCICPIQSPHQRSRLGWRHVTQEGLLVINYRQVMSPKPRRLGAPRLLIEAIIDTGQLAMRRQGWRTGAPKERHTDRGRSPLSCSETPTPASRMDASHPAQLVCLSVGVCPPNQLCFLAWQAC